jgi:hypothetical protein
MSETHRPASVLSWLIPALGHGTLLVAMLVRLAVAGPRYDRTFRDFHLKLPILSEWVIGASLWLAKYWYVLVPPVLGLIVVNALVLFLLGGWGRRAGWLWTWGIAGAVLCVWIVVELAFLLALSKLNEGLER